MVSGSSSVDTPRLLGAGITGGSFEKPCCLIYTPTSLLCLPEPKDRSSSAPRITIFHVNVLRGTYGSAPYGRSLLHDACSNISYQSTIGHYPTYT